MPLVVAGISSKAQRGAGKAFPNWDSAPVPPSMLSHLRKSRRETGTFRAPDENNVVTLQERLISLTLRRRRGRICFLHFAVNRKFAVCFLFAPSPIKRRCEFIMGNWIFRLQLNRLFQGGNCFRKPLL